MLRPEDESRSSGTSGVITLDLGGPWNRWNGNRHCDVVVIRTGENGASWRSESRIEVAALHTDFWERSGGDWPTICLD